MLRAIIFDFDGVIVESVDLKTQAFRELFKGYPDKVAEIERYHLDNGGLSRYEKFRHIYKCILKEDLTEKKFIELCQFFQRLVVDRVVEASFVPGAQELVAYCFNRFQMYVVSGTPQEEIREIVKRRNLGRFFLGVYGAPETKVNLINEILRKSNLNPKEVLFIGDSNNDYRAAQDTGILFFGRLASEKQIWQDDTHIEGSTSDMWGAIEYLKKSHLFKGDVQS